LIPILLGYLLCKQFLLDTSTHTKTTSANFDTLLTLTASAAGLQLYSPDCHTLSP
jgi:hypothetical protein